MGDVVQILERNYDLRKWEDELMAAEVQKKERKQKQLREKWLREERLRALKTCGLFCAATTGGGAAFLGIGVASGEVSTVAFGAILVIGAIIGGVFVEDMYYREEGKKR